MKRLPTLHATMMLVVLSVWGGALLAQAPPKPSILPPTNITTNSFQANWDNSVIALYQIQNYLLVLMIGKIIGIKVAEFIGTNSKTGEPTNGNYVSEIHKADKDFETMTGIKLELPLPIESAFSRNQPTGELPNDGIPF